MPVNFLFVVAHIQTVLIMSAYYFVSALWSEIKCEISWHSNGVGFFLYFVMIPYLAFIWLEDWLLMAVNIA